MDAELKQKSGEFQSITQRLAQVSQSQTCALLQINILRAFL